MFQSVEIVRSVEMMFKTCLGFTLFVLLLHKSEKAKGIFLKGLKGDDIDIFMYPFIVSVRTRETLRHRCMGVIFTYRWILTTGRCAGSHKAEDLMIVAGTKKAVVDTSNISFTDGTVHNVMAIVVHPRYDAHQYTDDLAMMKLFRSQPFVFSDKVKALKMGQVGDNSIETKFVGWNNVTMSLAKVILSTRDANVCFDMSQKLYDRLPGQICTYVAENQTPCNEDLGGPLMLGDNVVGMFSYRTVHCGMAGPFMFTRIYYYLDWITQTMKTCPCNRKNRIGGC